MDASHNGRIGNTVTVNGRMPGTFAVRSGERLRLINAATLDRVDHVATAL